MVSSVIFSGTFIASLSYFTVALNLNARGGSGRKTFGERKF